MALILYWNQYLVFKNQKFTGKIFTAKFCRTRRLRGPLIFHWTGEDTKICNLNPLYSIVFSRPVVYKNVDTGPGNC